MKVRLYTFIWFILTSITILSWWFLDGSTNTGDTTELADWVIPCAAFLAALKALLIAWFFMEVDAAPGLFKWLSIAWIIASASIVIAIYQEPAIALYIDSLQG